MLKFESDVEKSYIACEVYESLKILCRIYILEIFFHKSSVCNVIKLTYYF